MQIKRSLRSAPTRQCGIAALERCGVGHANFKLECRDYVAKTSKARGADVFASSFLGANLSRPAQGTKDVTDAQRSMTRIKAATQALYHASYADRVVYTSRTTKVQC